MQRRILICGAHAVMASTAAGLMILTLPALAQSPKIGDPPELGFATEDPAHFVRIFEDEGATIFRIDRR